MTCRPTIGPWMPSIDRLVYRSCHQRHAPYIAKATADAMDDMDDRAPLWDRLANFVGKVDYAGDWNLSPEWFGTQGGGWGRSEGDVIFDQDSWGGRVTVTAHPATPLPGEGTAEWRVLRFNETTRQSVTRIVDGAVDPGCLATEYLKTVAAVFAAVVGARPVVPKTADVLCIGIGGGSMTMFLNTYFPELTIRSVEIDPAVVSAARLMGADFEIIQQDANEFVVGSPPSSNAYEFVYIDAFDGDDCVPDALCGEDFARRVASELSAAGTLIVNLHADDPNWQRTSRVFRDAVGGVAFTCTCKRQGNVILCCSRVPQLISAVECKGPDEAKRKLAKFASKTYFGRSLPFRCGDRVTEGFSCVM